MTNRKKEKRYQPDNNLRMIWKKIKNKWSKKGIKEKSERSFSDKLKIKRKKETWRKKINNENQ